MQQGKWLAPYLILPWMTLTQLSVQPTRVSEDLTLPWFGCVFCLRLMWWFRLLEQVMTFANNQTRVAQKQTDSGLKHYLRSVCSAAYKVISSVSCPALPQCCNFMFTYCEYFQCYVQKLLWRINTCNTSSALEMFYLCNVKSALPTILYPGTIWTSHLISAHFLVVSSCPLFVWGAFTRFLSALSVCGWLVCLLRYVAGWRLTF